MLPVLALLAVNTLVPQRDAAMAATRLVAQPWHGPGAEQWRKMAGIVPRAYLCRRVDPAKPVSLADADIRTAEAWAHAPWTDEFVDIEVRTPPRVLAVTPALPALMATAPCPTAMACEDVPRGVRAYA